MPASVACKGCMQESLEEWQRILRVNLLGPVVAIQAVAPVMAKAGGGSIVLTASVAGLRSGAGSSAYSSSKAGVVSLAQTAACQLAAQNIRVNAICPGLIETGMTKPLLDSARQAGKGDKIGKHNPMRRAAEPHGDRHHGRLPGERRQQLHDGTGRGGGWWHERHASVHARASHLRADAVA